MGFVSQYLLKTYQLSVLTLWLAGIDAVGDTETITLATYFFLFLAGCILVSTTMAAYPKQGARLTNENGFERNTTTKLCQLSTVMGESDEMLFCFL
jgi:hypothetical protein